MPLRSIDLDDDDDLVVPPPRRTPGRNDGRNQRNSGDGDTTSKGILERMFAIEAADVSGLPLSASASFCMMCSYFYLQPLSDSLALQVGLAFTPAITACNVVLIALANPLYASLVRALPTPSVLPIVYGGLMAVLIAFGCLFTVMPESHELSFAFAVFIGTFSLFLTTTFWARMASFHDKGEAKRVYGVISAGAQAGQLTASVSAAALYAVLQQRIVFWSALIIGACIYLVNLRGALPQAQALTDAGDREPAPRESSGALGCLHTVRRARVCHDGRCGVVVHDRRPAAVCARVARAVCLAVVGIPLWSVST